MPFPESPRVVYEHNPLDEVICQLRFAPILRIQAVEPHEFQDELRGDYPHYQLQAPPDRVPSEMAALLSQIGRDVRRPKVHEFLDEHGHWKVGLSHDFIALSTNDYQSWREFRDRLTKVLDAVSTVYSPNPITRVGLRYKDVIHRSELGLDQCDWRELIASPVLGELSVADLVGAIEQRSTELQLRISDSARCVIRHGLGEIVAQEGAIPEKVYVIDSDFFTEEHGSLDNALDHLNEFNALAGRAFRWCITEKLHESLGPETRA